RVDVRVPMHGTPTQELRIGQPRNHSKHALLLARAQTRLEADEVPHPPAAILHAELRDRVGLPATPRVAQANRLHRPEAKRLAAAASHLLDRHASLEVRDRVEVMPLVLISG